jgi:aminoglycoside phosphotransferase (APT) family kinase protein
VIVTLWHYLPQPERIDRLPMAVLGRLLRNLHDLPNPPFALPTVEPLARLRSAVAVDAGRHAPVLSDSERCFLEERAASLEAAYADLTFPLGLGLIHNDAHIDNLLVDHTSPYGYVLADWEPAGHGPREFDLIFEGAPGNRFGLPEAFRREFKQAYGYDIACWPGWAVLRDIKDLH